ncbi:MAG: type 1 glutamine amidotransferase domain-containing protein, partial [Bdellovibrionota bacterium]
MKKKIMAFVFLSSAFLLLIVGPQIGRASDKDKEKKMKKVLIVVTGHDQLGSSERKTGYYLSEVAHPYFKLIDAGFQIDFASPKGKAAPMDERSRTTDDAINKKFLDDVKLMDKLNDTLAVGDIHAKDYVAIFFAGGHGTMWDFPDDKNIAQLASAIYEHGGVVAAVCHGPAALINIRLADGKFLIAEKTMTAFTNDEEIAAGVEKIVPFALESKLVERGAKFKKTARWQANVIVDERLVTGQNPA